MKLMAKIKALEFHLTKFTTAWYARELKYV